MEKILSITKNNEREVTITVPLKHENIAKLIVRYLSNATITCDLTLTLYKDKLQNIIVFNFKGDKDGINTLIESVDGLY